MKLKRFLVVTSSICKPTNIYILKEGLCGDQSLYIYMYLRIPKYLILRCMTCNSGREYICIHIYTQVDIVYVLTLKKYCLFVTHLPTPQSSEPRADRKSFKEGHLHCSVIPWFELQSVHSPSRGAGFKLCLCRNQIQAQSIIASHPWCVACFWFLDRAKAQIFEVNVHLLSNTECFVFNN